MKKNKRLFLSLLLGEYIVFAPAVMGQSMKIKLAVAQEVGSSVAFSINKEAKEVHVEWGDGKVMTYSTDSSGFLHTIAGILKGDTVTITGNDNMNVIDCSNCGIQDIDLKGAPKLRSLYCCNNSLTELDLRGLAHLVDLDCSNNQIEKLLYNVKAPEGVFSDLSRLENMNLSHNQLSGIFNLKLPMLQNLNVSDNNYVRLYVKSPNLKTVNCANNQIKGTLTLEKSEKLNSIVCNNNEIAELKLHQNIASLQQLVCDNNVLTELDLASATDLTDISCADNKLYKMVVGAKLKQLSTFNVSGNALTFSVLPPHKLAPVYISFMPQSPFPISKEAGLMEKNGVYYAPLSSNWSDKVYVDLREQSSLANKHRDSESHWYSVQPDGSEKEMTYRKSSSDNGDLYVLSDRFAFFTPQKKAYVRFKSKSYHYEIVSQPIAIGDDVTGVEAVRDDSRLKVSAVPGALVIECLNETPVHLYKSSGQLIWASSLYYS